MFDSTPSDYLSIVSKCDDERLIYPIRFKAEHITLLVPQDSQKWMLQYTAGAELMENEYAYTLMEDNSPLLCVGAIPFGMARCFLWTILSDKINKYNFRTMHSWAKIFINSLPFNRLEATAQIDYKQGHRWLKSLGFICEAECMRSFDYDGDHSLYALVRN